MKYMKVVEVVKGVVVGVSCSYLKVVEVKGVVVGGGGGRGVVVRAPCSTGSVLVVLVV